MNEFMQWLFVGIGAMAILTILFLGEPLVISGVSEGKEVNITVIEEQGLVLIGPENVETWRRIDLPKISTSKMADETVHEIPDTHLYNGLLFGSNKIRYKIFANASKLKTAKMTFSVDNTNNYGNLVVKLNGHIVFNKQVMLGQNSFDIDSKHFKNENVLEIYAASSLWRMWAPAFYDLSSIKLVLSEFAERPQKIYFDVYSEEYNSITEVKMNFHLTKNIGTIRIMLNGNEIHDGEIQGTSSLSFDKSYIQRGENLLELSTSPNSEYEGQAYLMIFYRTDRTHALEQSVDITQSRYNTLTTNPGKILFKISKIISQGKFYVKMIDADGLEHQIARESVRATTFSYEFGKSDVKPGENKIIIESDGSTVFYIKDFRVEY